MHAKLDNNAERGFVLRIQMWKAEKEHIGPWGGDGYNNRRPHRILLLSAKKRKQELGGFGEPESTVTSDSCLLQQPLMSQSTSL